ncbi:hypothetical protein LYNGBM3L_16060 [Moorena producens 3L]|uniref:Uncharacterized protein n=1 Tax=Moorena producens 3L TaxID=489825 RepID=F4XLU6_9CYAN|nr:hypothetical protein LYNGBM3L_16060 [Moorena producens 3L]
MNTIVEYTPHPSLFTHTLEVGWGKPNQLLHGEGNSKQGIGNKEKNICTS